MDKYQIQLFFLTEEMAYKDGISKIKHKYTTSSHYSHNREYIPFPGPPAEKDPPPPISICR